MPTDDPPARPGSAVARARREVVRHCVRPVLATMTAVVRPWSALRHRDRVIPSTAADRAGMICLPPMFDGVPVPRPPTTIEGGGRPARVPRWQPDGPEFAPSPRPVLDRAYVEGGIRRLEELLGAPLPSGTFDDAVIAGLLAGSWPTDGSAPGPGSAPSP